MSIYICCLSGFLILYENDRKLQGISRIKMRSYLFMAEGFKYKIKHLVVVGFQ